jgi:hypothetical protein
MKGGLLVNDILEAKLFVGRIKVEILDLTGALIADDSTDKKYAVEQLLKIVEYIEEHEISIKEIEDSIVT